MILVCKCLWFVVCALLVACFFLVGGRLVFGVWCLLLFVWLLLMRVVFCLLDVYCRLYFVSKRFDVCCLVFVVVGC